MDLATLKALKPAEYEGAADGYRATGEMASAAKDTIDNQVCAGVRNQLEGKAATAALGELRHLSENFHYVQVECGLISTALNGFAFDMAVAKRRLETAIEDAHADGCTVGSDGSVSYPAGKKPGEEKMADGGTVTGSAGGSPTSGALERKAMNIHPNPNYGKALGYANRIADALEGATEADAKWAPKLRALKADDDLVVSKRDWADTQSDRGGVREAGKDYFDSLPEPPKDGSPKDNAAWWKGLSAEEQSAHLALNAAAVGALDGLPAETRDEANRTVLAQSRAQVELELAKIPPEPTRYFPNTRGAYPAVIQNPSWSDWNEKHGERFAQLTKSNDGMKGIQERFDATGENGLPPAYLLGFDTEKNGRAIVANGNPDTAAHTAVYVPGTTSNLGDISGDIGRMTDLWRESDAMAGGKEVSTITWLGYDAPQSVVKDAPFRHYADDGAPAFNQFMDGLNVTNSTDSGGHHTAIGHSYGTTLIGSAARQGELNVDDVVFAGSPGVQVGEAAQMDVPDGHVWNEEAEGDPVPDLGRFGHGGSQWRFGGGVAIIPSDELFGANQMTTGGSEGHSEYWERDSESLKNQAAVVTGRYGKVELEE
ncbi:alpha/beta hydrolase [Streptomyces sp. ID03-2B]|uniref:alpha/beta hydrolase n=1 Tax=Streptomyces TaxID=1883 RepID=UPI0029A345BE|nr:alpha/beta hydrolase [Streptomyces sp. ID03-2B]MDX3595746.1 alpha/beta hydrolase [Streptomyces sp. ID03-2B]